MIEKGDIFFVNHYGQTNKKGRPAVVISGAEANRRRHSIILAYLSKNPSDSANDFLVPIGLYGKRSYAILNKPSTVTKDRLDTYVGRATDEEIAALESGLCKILEL